MYDIYYFRTIEKNLNRKEAFIDSNKETLQNTCVFNPFIFCFTMIGMIALIGFHIEYEYKVAFHNHLMTAFLNIYSLYALLYYFLKDSLISLNSKGKTKNELNRNKIIMILIAVGFIYVSILSIFLPEPIYLALSLAACYYAFKSINKLILKSDYNKLKEQYANDIYRFDSLKNRIVFVLNEKSKQDDKQFNIFKKTTEIYSLKSLNNIIQTMKN